MNVYKKYINETGTVLVLEARGQDIAGIEDWPSNNHRFSALEKRELSGYPLVRLQCMDRR